MTTFMGSGAAPLKLEEAVDALPINARLDKIEKMKQDKFEKTNEARIKKGKPPLKPKEKKQEYKADGYTRPIYVRKGEWVLRLRKRVGYMCYDRSRCKDWWELVGKSVVGENARKVFYSQILNVRQPMTLGETASTVGTLKGHVTVERQPMLEDGSKPTIKS